ncbi:MAG: exo-alpha-sialidase [Kiritimatiellaeota bacterium]|nr:exo-alpha-sialidase [Kiritimatiellota bacterium]
MRFVYPKSVRPGGGLSSRGSRLFLTGFLVAVATLGVGPADRGFEVVELSEERLGSPIVRTDFERCTPRRIIKKVDEDRTGKWLADGPERDRADGYWLLRHPVWTRAVLNAEGRPADLVYDPKLEGPYHIYLGLRAVEPNMSLAVKLSDEEDFDVITAPAVTSGRDFNFEFHWRAAADLTGRQIVIRSVGRKVYLQSFRFVPILTVTRKYRAVADHVTICKTVGRHHAFPGIDRLPDGGLGVVFRDGIAHVCPFGRIMLTRSRDEGRTWTQPVVIWDSPSDERDPSIHALPNGRILVTFNVWNSWMASVALRKKFAEQTARILKDGQRAYTGRKAVFSDDSGRTWTQPIDIPPFTPHGPALGPDGGLYCPTWRNREGRRHVMIWRSADGGRVWEEYADVGASAADFHDKQVVYDEPYLVIPPKGPWIVTIRVQVDGYVRQAFSTNGRRWSPVRKTRVRGFPQHILALKDGRLLMTYGYRYKPYGIRACISRDRGRSWDVDREILLAHGAPTPDLGYPVSIELKDGRVFTVYYYNDPAGECYIEGAFYRP